MFKNGNSFVVVRQVDARDTASRNAGVDMLIVAHKNAVGTEEDGVRPGADQLFR